MKSRQVDAVKHRAPKKATAASWKPGVSGNPSGRPRVGNSLAEVFRDYLNEPLGTPLKKTCNRKEALVDRLFKLTEGKSYAVGASRLICETVGNFEIEERLQVLERKMDMLEGGNNRGT